jgi:hypothetical protein
MPPASDQIHPTNSANVGELVTRCYLPHEQIEVNTNPRLHSCNLGRAHTRASGGVASNARFQWRLSGKKPPRTRGSERAPPFRPLIRTQCILSRILMSTGKGRKDTQGRPCVKQVFDRVLSEGTVSILLSVLQCVGDGPSHPLYSTP